MINQKFHAIRASIISGQKGNEYLILSTKSACKKCSPSTFEKGMGKFDIITTFEPPERHYGHQAPQEQEFCIEKIKLYTKFHH